MAWLAPLGTMVAIALAAPAPAPAPRAVPGPGVGMLPLRLPVDVSAPDQDELNQRFEDGVTRSGLSTTPMPNEAASCQDPGCYQAVGKGAEVELLVGGTVAKTGPDYAVQVYVISSDTGEVVAQVDGVCEICGIGELGDVVGSLAARLRPTLENATQPSTLSVDSDPVGAEVWVDGEQVGITPLQTTITPGEHEIDVIKRGRRTEHEEVSVRPGVNQSFSYRLARTTRVPHWLPWAGVGAGVASLGTGIALLVADENPIRRDCNADADGRCEYLYDTVDGGVVLTVVGVALIGTGVGLLLSQRREDRVQRSGVQARVHVEPGIGGASLVGRF